MDEGISGGSGGCGLGDTALFDLGGDWGCGIGSDGLGRGGRESPEEPAESDLAERVTVADRDLGAGASFRNVSSGRGISICIGAIGPISGNRRSKGAVPMA
jgi:hypothetical protein